MFGKPEWFREKTIGWGLVPVHWRGWIYSAAWATVLGGPFLLLVQRQQAIEAVIWLAAALSALVWDVRAILRAKRSSRRDVLYIGDDEALPDQVGTHRFDFQWRK